MFQIRGFGHPATDRCDGRPLSAALESPGRGTTPKGDDSMRRTLIQLTSAILLAGTLVLPAVASAQTGGLDEYQEGAPTPGGEQGGVPGGTGGGGSSQSAGTSSSSGSSD